MTSLSQRLPLLYKFLILGLAGILMSAVPTWLFVSGAPDDLAHARHEARGAPPLLALHKVVQGLQVHRGLSNGMLGGDETLAARRPAARDAVNKAFAAKHGAAHGADHVAAADRRAAAAQLRAAAGPRLRHQRADPGLAGACAAAG